MQHRYALENPGSWSSCFNFDVKAYCEYICPPRPEKFASRDTDRLYYVLIPSRLESTLKSKHSIIKSQGISPLRDA